MTWTAGTVIKYSPAERFDRFWCREGMAIAEERADGSVFFADTYWGSGMDRHILSDAEVATAEVLFRLDDYRLVDRNETWDDFAPDDRQVITSQHRLQQKLYVRIGSTPDLDTKLENARAKVRAAEEGVEAAKHQLKWAQHDLGEIAERVIETGAR